MITPISHRTTPGKPQSGRRFVVTALTLLMVAVGSLTAAAPAPAATPYWRCSRLTPINGGPTAVSACVHFTQATRSSSAAMSVRAVLYNGSSVTKTLWTAIFASDDGVGVGDNHAVFPNIPPHATATLSVTAAVDSKSGKHIVGSANAGELYVQKHATVSATWRH